MTDRLLWYGFKHFEQVLAELRTPFVEVAETYRRSTGTTFLHSAVRCFTPADLERFMEAYPMNVHDVDDTGRTAICECTTLGRVQIMLRAGAYLTYPVLEYYSKRRDFTLIVSLMYQGHLSLLSVTKLYQSLEGTPNRWSQRSKRRVVLLWRYRASCQRAAHAMLNIKRNGWALPRDVIWLLARAIWATRRNKKWLFIDTTQDP